MSKRIEFDDAARGALRRGVDRLAFAVRVTLGPRGRNVVIDRAHGSPSITNDGLAIAREIELPDPLEDMGVRMVREAALKTGEDAGDGTTTATVLAHALVSEGLRAVAAGHHPLVIKRGMDRAVLVAVEEIRRQARPVDEHGDIARIATVSARHDPRLGDLVAEALERVGRDGVVTVEEGRTLETTLEVAEGVRIAGGWLSPYFVSDPESMEAVLDRPLVLLADLRLTAVQDVVGPLDLAARAGRPLLVIAEDIEGEALATLVVNRLRGNVPSAGVRAPESGDRRRALLEDLAVLTGAQLLAPDLGRRADTLTGADLGRAGRAVVEREQTTIIQGGGRGEVIGERLAGLERELAAADSAYDRDQLRVRIARLRGGVAVLRVGAATELEMAEKRGRLEDALAAARAAVAEGVVTGGGVALLRARAAVAALELPGGESAGRDVVLAALEAPARQIASNAGEDGQVAVARILEAAGGWGYNALSGVYEDLAAAGILDPAKVTRCALQNAASVAGLVLSTDAVVVDGPGSGEPPAAPGA